MLDFPDSDGRLSSDRIPHARMSKTTRFADAVLQQEPQLSSITSGMKSGVTTDAVPAQLEGLKQLLVPSRVSMLLVLTGVIISLQVSNQQPFLARTCPLCSVLITPGSSFAVSDQPCIALPSILYVALLIAL